MLLATMAQQTNTVDSMRTSCLSARCGGSILATSSEPADTRGCLGRFETGFYFVRLTGAQVIYKHCDEAAQLRPTQLGPTGSTSSICFRQPTAATLSLSLPFSSPFHLSCASCSRFACFSSSQIAACVLFVARLDFLQPSPSRPIPDDKLASPRSAFVVFNEPIEKRR